VPGFLHHTSGQPAPGPHLRPGYLPAFSVAFEVEREKPKLVDAGQGGEMLHQFTGITPDPGALRDRRLNIHTNAHRG